MNVPNNNPTPIPFHSHSVGNGPSVDGAPENVAYMRAPEVVRYDMRSRFFRSGDASTLNQTHAYIRRAERLVLEAKGANNGR